MGRSLRILVVDDDRDNADSLAELLEMEGHTVSTAYSAAEAEAAYAKNDFDLAFIDVIMPGKSGLDSFLEIRRARPGAKVFMMTGYSVEQLIQQAMDRGALGVLSKPVDIGQVLEAVDHARPSGIVVVPGGEPGLAPQLKDAIEASGRPCKLVAASGNPTPADGEPGAAGETLVVDLDSSLIDGLQLYRSLSEQNAAASAVFVAAKTQAHEDLYEALGDVEITGILNKPFDPIKLLDKLERLAD